jgi:formylglycine-generating enzyme required for sulfatase activity
MKDGNMIEAKIMEIHPNEIRYKRADNLNGPMIILLKDGVLSVKYENGVVEVINAPSAGQGSGQQLGTPTPLQIILNTLPTIRIAGNKLKFQFGGDNWVATLNGENFLTGTIELEDTNGGSILNLKQTHMWPGAAGKAVGKLASKIPGGSAVGGALDVAGNIAGAAGAIEASGPVIVLGYKAGPPAKLTYLRSTTVAPTVTPEHITFGEMVLINGGTFTMGSPANEPGRSLDETQHQVTLSSFYIGKYEVTQNEYQAVMGTNPSRLKGNNLPVDRVSWYNAIEYCNAFSQWEGLTPVYTIDKRSTDPNNSSNIEDKLKWVVIWDRNANGYRLPTEAEWEYACRAGTTTAYNTGWSSISDDIGWYNANSGQKSHPVGEKPANSWGLHDMHGNVREWCWDWYGKDSYASGNQTDPIGEVSGSKRVARGGGLGNIAKMVRSAYRFSYSPSYWKDDNLGFRVVRSQFAPQSVPTVSPDSLDSRYIVLADAQWVQFVATEKESTRKDTTVRFSIANEEIGGQVREVLTVETNLAKGSGWRYSELQLTNETMVQTLQKGSGVRFKMLGDGKRWKLLVGTDGAAMVACYYEIPIITKTERLLR